MELLLLSPYKHLIMNFYCRKRSFLYFPLLFHFNAKKLWFKEHSSWFFRVLHSTQNNYDLKNAVFWFFESVSWFWSRKSEGGYLIKNKNARDKNLRGSAPKTLIRLSVWSKPHYFEIGKISGGRGAIALSSCYMEDGILKYTCAKYC